MTPTKSYGDCGDCGVVTGEDDYCDICGDEICELCMDSHIEDYHGTAADEL